MSTPEIACIIPVKDRRELVAQAIESVLTQTLHPQEIVVVDDGSKDGTPEAIKRRFPQVKLIKARGLGPGGARNLGAESTKAKILMFLDSDDLWMNNHVNELLCPIYKHGGCSFGITLNEGPYLGKPFLIPGKEFDKDKPIHKNLFRWCSLVPSSFAIERNIFLEAGGFLRLALGEDWLFFTTVALRYRFHFVPVIVTKRRIHAQNLCWKNFSAKSALYVIKKLQKMASKNSMDKEVRHLEKISSLIVNEGNEWKNVQDWYMSLRRHSLI